MSFLSSFADLWLVWLGIAAILYVATYIISQHVKRRFAPISEKIRAARAARRHGATAPRIELSAEESRVARSTIRLVGVLLLLYIASLLFAALVFVALILSLFL